MNTIPNEGGVTTSRRRRRNHSDEFKAQVVAACRPAGVSMAAVALAHGISAHLARRWVAAAERRSASQPAAGSSSGGAASTSFIPLTLTPTVAPPTDIRIELRRGATLINVSWPISAAPLCATWLRELLR